MHIALHEGFLNDNVVIEYEGKEVFNKSEIKTKQQIGFADSIEVNVNNNPTIVVKIPSRGISKNIEVDVEKTPYIGLSLTSEGTLETKFSAEPFRYM